MIKAKLIVLGIKFLLIKMKYIIGGGGGVVYLMIDTYVKYDGFARLANFEYEFMQWAIPEKKIRGA